MGRKILAWIVVFLLLLPFLILILSGCSAPRQAVPETVPQTTAPVETETEGIGDIETVYSEYAVIDIAVGEDGAYCLMAEISVDMLDGEPIGVVICDPTLLAFQVSSKHDNGVFLFDMNDGFEAIDELKDIRDALVDQGNAELAERVQNVIDRFDRAGPYCGEST